MSKWCGATLSAVLVATVLVSINPLFSQETKQIAKSEEKDSPKSLGAFQGFWQLDRVEADGRTLPNDLFGSASLEVKGGKYELIRKTTKETKVKGSLAVPEAKATDSQTGKDKATGADLVAVDIIPEGEDGPLDPQKAVFAVIGGKLHLCSGPPGVARPASLNTNGRENVTLMVFSRKKQ